MMNGVRDVAFLSAYPPRKCDLAKYTEDLVGAIAKAALVEPHVIAISDDAEKYEDPRVRYLVGQKDRESYLRAAEWANTHVDWLVIEHEYGMFGDESGGYIVDLAQNLKIPFIVTLHTILEAPSPNQKAVLQKLGQLSVKLVAMAENSVPILTGTYGIGTEKIRVIPHGVPNILVGSREKLKVRHGLKNKLVISSLDLLSPDKGIEYGIEAVAKVAAKFDNVVYLVSGKTHSTVQDRFGGSYRQSLGDLAESLGVGNKVHFIDKLLTREEIIQYLRLSDICMTPYLSEDKAVSGTLAYAVGCGRVVVATPFPYAREMLDNGRGMLAEFRDSDSLASCIEYILCHAQRKKEMEKKTLAIGQMMTWEKVASRYVQLLIRSMEELRIDREGGEELDHWPDNDREQHRQSLNELKIYRLMPEDVERLLLAQYGDKLEAVNASKLEKQNRKHSKYDSSY